MDPRRRVSFRFRLLLRVDLATAPIDNFITEFVPSIAAHIHTHVVFMQRIVNEVATTGKVP